MSQSSAAEDNCEVENTDLYKFYFSVMIAELVLALPLNLSVIYLFIFKLKFWKSKSNSIFLFNLVLADILLLICLPVRAANFFQEKRRNDDNATCTSILFLLFLNRGASIAFLTVISIHRYYSVVHPGIKNPLKTRKHSIIISVLIWLCLVPLTIPTMLKSLDCCNNSNTEDDITHDTDKEKVIVFFRELVFFSQVLIPFAVLLFCTIQITNRLKQKSVGDRTKLRKAVFLVTVVVLVFALCFLPSAISRLVLLITKVNQMSGAERIVVQVYDGLMCLSYLDCLMDPIVYCLSSSKFKHLYISTFLPFLLKGQHAEHH